MSFDRKGVRQHRASTCSAVTAGMSAPTPTVDAERNEIDAIERHTLSRSARPRYQLIAVAQRSLKWRQSRLTSTSAGCLSSTARSDRRMTFLANDGVKVAGIAVGYPFCWRRRIWGYLRSGLPSDTTHRSGSGYTAAETRSTGNPRRARRERRMIHAQGSSAAAISG